MRSFFLAASILLASCATSTPTRTQLAGIATDQKPFKVSCELVAPVMPNAIGSGTVVARAKIVGGKVEDVQIVSGRFEFHNSVTRAMKQYKCDKLEREVVVMQEFNFRVMPDTAATQK